VAPTSLHDPSNNPSNSTRQKQFCKYCGGTERGGDFRMKFSRCFPTRLSHTEPIILVAFFVLCQPKDGLNSTFDTNLILIASPFLCRLHFLTSKPHFIFSSSHKYKQKLNCLHLQPHKVTSSPHTSSLSSIINASTQPQTHCPSPFLPSHHPTNLPHLSQILPGPSPGPSAQPQPHTKNNPCTHVQPQT
jgi:hypothetical protein